MVMCGVCVWCGTGCGVDSVGGAEAIISHLVSAGQSVAPS
jgi:hypothetical protein